ncbi:MAG: hypothetical protein AAF709_15065, partial [Pseudomonadota bacterium]
MAYTRYGFLVGIERLPVALCLASMMMFLAAPVHAQKKPATNPVGAGWDSKVKAGDGAAGQAFTDEQTAAIK